MFDLREGIWRDEGDMETHLNAITSMHSDKEFETTMCVIRIARQQAKLGGGASLHNRKILALRDAFQKVSLLVFRNLLLLTGNVFLVCDQAIGLCEHLGYKLRKTIRPLPGLDKNKRISHQSERPRRRR